MCDKLSLMITRVEINEKIQNKLDKDIEDGHFDSDVRELIAFWIMEIKEIGYDEYIISSLAKSFNDHQLKGARQGERAIHLNTKGGRLIYKYYKNKIIVKVIKITPDHDYS
jgi:mRNA-degrading endonuclease YafQ of YafQ-DinJ toxin-antitoxin module